MGMCVRGGVVPEPSCGPQLSCVFESFTPAWCNPLGYFSCLPDLITASNAG